MEHSLLMILASIGSSLVVGALSSYITARVRLESFLAMDTEREKHFTQWRQKFEQSVNSVVDRLGLIEQTGITQAAFNTLRTDGELRARRLEEVMDRHADEAKKDRHAINNVLSQLMARMAVQEEITKSDAKSKR